MVWFWLFYYGDCHQEQPDHGMVLVILLWGLSPRATRSWYGSGYFIMGTVTKSNQIMVWFWLFYYGDCHQEQPDHGMVLVIFVVDNMMYNVIVNGKGSSNWLSTWLVFFLSSLTGQSFVIIK